MHFIYFSKYCTFICGTTSAAQPQVVLIFIHFFLYYLHLFFDAFSGTRLISHQVPLFGVRAIQLRLHLLLLFDDAHIFEMIPHKLRLIRHFFKSQVFKMVCVVKMVAWSLSLLILLELTRPRTISQLVWVKTCDVWTVICIWNGFLLDF